MIKLDYLKEVRAHCHYKSLWVLVNKHGSKFSIGACFIMKGGHEAYLPCSVFSSNDWETIYSKI